MRGAGESNSEVSAQDSARAAIENINKCLTTSAIVGGVHRGSVNDSQKITKIIQVFVILCKI